LAELGFPANPANAPKIARIGPANTGVGLICQGFPADAVRRSRVRSSDALDSQNAGYCYQGKPLIDRLHRAFSASVSESSANGNLTNSGPRIVKVSTAVH
jgi:hypothetical protein